MFPPPLPKQRGTEAPYSVCIVGLNETQEPVMFNVKKQRACSKLQFRVLSNDHSQQCLLWLFEAQTIVKTSLVSMPQDYISSVVFDDCHETGILTDDGQAVATIVYRPFIEEHFVELVFCCVRHNKQSSGYGRILMNSWKTHLQALSVCHVVVYADNSAVGYFQRQGFTATFPKNIREISFTPFIKEYDGATFMYCSINPDIDYKRMNEWTYSLSEYVESMIPPKPIRSLRRGQTEICGIPIPTQKTDVTKEEKMMAILDLIVRKNDSIYFQRPISEADNPMYRDFISQPMDLATMRAKMTIGQYETLDDFVSDLHLIFHNCYSYNEDDSEYYQAARRLEEYSRELCRRAGATYPD